MTISSQGERPFNITDIRSTIEDKIKYELKPIKEGNNYSLEIRTNAGIKESFHGKVIMKTTNQKKPKLELFVMGNVQEETKISPQYIYFGIIDTSKDILDTRSLKKTIFISSVRGNDLIIESIESSSKWITTEIETNTGGDKKHSIVITLNKDKLPKWEFREKVTIRIRYSEKSEVVDIILGGRVI